MSEHVLYSDSFEDLDGGWHWLRERADHWRIVDNGLEIRVEPGLADTVVNALLRSAPDRNSGAYIVEVTVSNLQAPIQQYEQIGITWYSGEKPVFKLVKELIDGDVYVIPGKCPVSDEPIRLRLTVDGHQWKAEYKPESADTFALAAEGELPAPDGDHVSLQCYNGPEEAEHWVRFEEFSITRAAP